MRKLAILAAMAAATSIGVVAPASADTPRCVSRAEFRAVKDGWSITRVYNRFDVTGSQDWYQAGDREYDWPATQGRSYRACTRYGTVFVDFERYPGDVWRVTSKSAYW
jgi:hypothetical protein